MSIEDQIEQIARTVVLQELAQRASPMRDKEADETRLKIERIKVKEFVSINEAAFLLRCSDQHLRNLAQCARGGNTCHPIPFCDLDGPITFPLAELLNWTRLIKPKQPKAVGGKRKTKAQLQRAA
jgi:hypothetical protein